MKIAKDNKLNVILLLFITALVFIILTTATLAWFAGQDTGTGTVQMGGAVSVSINTNSQGNFDVNIPANNLLPGMKVSPNISINVEQSSTPIVMRAKINATVDDVADDELATQINTSISSVFSTLGNAAAWVEHDGWFYFKGNNTSGTLVMSKTSDGEGATGGTKSIPNNNAEYQASTNRANKNPITDTVLGSIYSGGGGVL